MKLLQVEGLSKKYPQFTLKDVSFSLEEGEIMGLIGKNGAGKSTTLKSILNMVYPDKGKILIDGREFRQFEIECKQKIGVVLGGIDFYNYKKLSNITTVTRKFYHDWDDFAYQKYMQMFELDEKKRVNQLSAGMKVKYLIAIALSHKAKLLILDEPTSGLDPVARDDLLELFTQLVKDGSRSILFSTHITSDLDKCANSITYIKNGQILKTAKKEQFISYFQYLKNPDETDDLNLEEIMIRTERKTYHV
ncbi:MAG: ABC transporter ATP-binding protein [Christensenellaceae bacterium]|nr:ABC transporter ATP-binding protein [Christensenellaceae bacterium]